MNFVDNAVVRIDGVEQTSSPVDIPYAAQVDVDVDVQCPVVVDDICLEPGSESPTSFTVTCDDKNMAVYLDGVAQSVDSAVADDWETTATIPISTGTKVVRVECENKGGKGSILGFFNNGMATDGTWSCSNQGFDVGMGQAVTHGMNRGGPWPEFNDVCPSANWIWTEKYKYNSGAGDAKVYCEVKLSL